MQENRRREGLGPPNSSANLQTYWKSLTMRSCLHQGKHHHPNECYLVCFLLLVLQFFSYSNAFGANTHDYEYCSTQTMNSAQRFLAKGKEMKALIDNAADLMRLQKYGDAQQSSLILGLV